MCLLMFVFSIRPIDVFARPYVLNSMKILRLGWFLISRIGHSIQLFMIIHLLIGRSTYSRVCLILVLIITNEISKKVQMELKNLSHMSWRLIQTNVNSGFENFRPGLRPIKYIYFRAQMSSSLRALRFIHGHCQWDTDRRKLAAAASPSSHLNSSKLTTKNGFSLYNQSRRINPTEIHYWRLFQMPQLLGQYVHSSLSISQFPNTFHYDFKT